MNISQLIVHAQLIEKSKLKQMNTEVKTPTTGNENFSNVKSKDMVNQVLNKGFLPRFL